MNTQMAIEIIAQATKYAAFELPDLGGKDPAEMSIEEIKTYIKLDDADAHDEAALLITLATGAFTRSGIRSDAIMEILYAAKITSPADEPGAFKEVYDRHGDSEPAPDKDHSDSSAAAFGGAVLSEPEAAAADGKVDISSIVSGYDDYKVADLKKAIMESAASGDLTEAEWEQIKAYEEANEERKTILRLTPEFKKPEPEPAQASAPSGSGFSTTSPDPGYGNPEQASEAYEEGSLGLDQVYNEGLPIPREYGGDEPVLPVDITQVSHEELSRLVMRFHSLEARALWLISQEAGRRDVADGLAKDAWSDAFARNFSRLKSEIEKETGTAIDNARSQAKHEADVDETVKTWRMRALRHGAEVRSLEALAIGWEKANSRLSREQSRREKLAETRS